MFWSIGHRLPGGFYGRIGGGTYHCRVDNSTLVRGGSAASGIGTALKLVVFISFMAFLIWCRLRYAP